MSGGSVVIHCLKRLVLPGVVIRPSETCVAQQSSAMAAGGALEPSGEPPAPPPPINYIYTHLHDSIRAELDTLATAVLHLQQADARGAELCDGLRELRYRWRFLEKVYKYHSSVEDEASRPAPRHRWHAAATAAGSTPPLPPCPACRTLASTCPCASFADPPPLPPMACRWCTQHWTQKCEM